MAPVLRVRSLSVAYVGRRSAADAVSGIDLDVEAGEILGLAGESGCGKTTLATALLGLVEPPGKIQSGSLEFRGHNGAACDLLTLPPAELRQLLWKELAYVPQSSMSALNPVLRVRQQMTDTLIQHGMSKAEANKRACWALETVSLDTVVLDRYPHELSGGMAQRVAIAMAVSMQPALIVADEPTSALDVITQRSILQELVGIRSRFRTSILLISHDMGVMAQAVDRLAVMYAGRVVEVGPVGNVFATPMHPYTQKLIASIPKEGSAQLAGLSGESPSPWRQPLGCRFHPRCPCVMDICRSQVPILQERRPGQCVACHLGQRQETLHG